MHGALGGTGKLIILPVDQGFEHGPTRSFACNPNAYDPHYHYSLAIEAGLSAYAAPLGALEAGSKTFAGKIPTILKMNSANSLVDPSIYHQAITASVDDAVRLGCVGIGFTIYPGSDFTYEMMEQIQYLSQEAKAAGLLTVIWSYPRGNMSKEGETAIDVVSYGAHMAALLGAHLIKVKLPSAHIEKEEDRQAIEEENIKIDTLADRVKYVRKCTFNGRRIVIFSGGSSKGMDAVLDDAHAIKEGKGFGSIIGRNAFQRPHHEAMDLLNKMIDIYKS
jgi:class I fructose-bisphosphate aldolase